jgi:hypothetical protein
VSGARLRASVPRALACAAVALILASCAQQPSASPPPPAAPKLPRELTASDWSRTPEKVIASPIPDERLVWAGTVDHFSYRPLGDQIESQFVFHHLAFRGPGPRAVMSRPVPVERDGDGYFVVRYTNPAAQSDAEQVRRDLEMHHPQFALAGGKFDSVIEVDGQRMVLLKEVWVETGTEIAAFPR